MRNILKLRQTLHDNAELSGNEKNTNLIINDFLNNLNYHKIIRNIGGYGIAVLFKGNNNGKRIMVRADIDGLNIKEGDRSFHIDADMTGILPYYVDWQNVSRKHLRNEEKYYYCFNRQKRQDKVQKLSSTTPT